MAVSKVHPVEAIFEAYAGGAAVVRREPRAGVSGEVGSARLADGAEFHLIGPLQSNKTNKAAELFDAVDAVDSLKIAQRLDTAAGALGKRLPVLIEVKLSHEESKHGIAPAELPALLDAMQEFEGGRGCGVDDGAAVVGGC